MYPIEKYDFKVYESKNEDGTKSSVVVALSTYCGKTVKGVAKCAETDPFDLEKGKKLAAARCDYKVCLKRMKRAKSKKFEAANQLETLTKQYVDMTKYFDDSMVEVAESFKRLKSIEKELS